MRHLLPLPLASLSLALLLLAAGASAQVDFWKHEWPATDFSRAAVPLKEIISGGPPRDGIPAITNPQTVRAAEEREIPGPEPVMTVEIGGEARAYPLRYLVWHEIVNDTIAGVPVAVTWCPLCNSGIVYDRRLDGRTLTFGVTGKLRNSDMVMYDRETESWWQQFTGEAIVGTLTGQRLKKLPAWVESFGDFRARNPQGLVMARPAHDRPYGQTPYAGYDSAARPFLYSGEMPPHGIAPLARVVVVGKRAWPLERVRKAGTLREAGYEISWVPGVASPLDARQMAKGREIGSVRVRKNGRDVPHDLAFAFAFHAFHPDGEWMLGE